MENSVIRRLPLLAAAIIMAAIPSGAQSLEWDKITHWVGSGDCRSALVVRFGQSDRSLIWGYRWESGSTLTVKEMMCDIAHQGADLDVMVQYTGNMGYTLCGMGFSRYHDAIANLEFDLAGASSDRRISFGWFEPALSMGQTSAPAERTYDIVQEALEKAGLTNVLNHPFNAEDYGYPAYDYDYWRLRGDTGDDAVWDSGWYEGYWSFFTGDSQIGRLSFSGMGMSSVPLADGMVAGWYYQITEPDNPFGETGYLDWSPLDYDHYSPSTGIGRETCMEQADDCDVSYYHPDGRYAGKSRHELTKGIYIRKTSKSTKRILIY